MIRNIIIIAGFAALSASCSTISKDSCIAGSWESLGYEDGRNGESRGHFNKIAKACAKYGISANVLDYRAGYETGVRQYCSYDRGYRHGEAGRALKTECREINSTPYFDGYNTGLPIYCSFDRGFDHGEAGKSANAQCRKISAIPYLDGHEEGRGLYEIRSEYEARIDAYDDTRSALEDVVYRLSSVDMNEDERTRLRKKKRRLERELDETRIDIRAFEQLYDWPKQALPLLKFGPKP